MSDERPIMQRLREDTAVLHRNAENMAFEQALMKGSLPKEVYVNSLEQRLLVHRALEAALKHHKAYVPAIAAVFADHHVHSGRLEEDLRFLGRDPQKFDALPATQDAVAMVKEAAEKNPVALLGIHYVFEGSTNGARYLAKAVAGAYRMFDGRGVAYLNSTGEKQPENWRGFKVAMDAQTFSENEKTAIVEAAKATFAAVAAIDGELYPEPVGA